MVLDQVYTFADKFHFQNREFWIPAVLLISILLVIWARNSYHNQFTRISNAFFNIREFYQVVREEYAMTNSLSVGLAILFVLISSVFIWQLNGYFHYFPVHPTAFLFYLKIVVVVLCFFLAKLLIVRALGALFFGKAELVTDFMYNIFLMNVISGLVLIPIVLFLEYFRLISVQLLIYLSCWLLVFVYAYRLWRSFRITSGAVSVSKLYFFAYLCSLEIVPFVVIFKVIIRK